MLCNTKKNESVKSLKYLLMSMDHQFWSHCGNIDHWICDKTLTSNYCYNMVSGVYW